MPLIFDCLIITTPESLFAHCSINTDYGKQMVLTGLSRPSTSTVNLDEYTHAVDSILRPDIVIPYGYQTGRDTMLDLLIEIIIRSRADTTE